MLFSVRQRGQVIDELTENLEARVSPSRDLQEIRSKALEAIERSQKYAAEKAQLRNKSAKKFKVGDYCCNS